MGSRLESRTVSLLVQHQRNCGPLVARVTLLGFSPKRRAKHGERLSLRGQMTTSEIELLGEANTVLHANDFPLNEPLMESSDFLFPEELYYLLAN